MSQVVIVTSTFYKSVEELRFVLAVEMVKSAIASGYRVVVVDASPIPDVAVTLKGLGALVFPQLHKGMGPGRRQGFFHAFEVASAQGVPFIMWMEPEKIDLIRFVDDIVAPLEADEADIVIPQRSEIAWSTWPAFQVESEKLANSSRLYWFMTRPKHCKEMNFSSW